MELPPNIRRKVIKLSEAFEKEKQYKFKIQDSFLIPPIARNFYDGDFEKDMEEVINFIRGTYK